MKNKLSKRRKAIACIAFFFKTRPNKQFHGYDLTNFVNALAKMKLYPDTVLRYMRQMRERGMIDYEQVGKKADSLYKVKKIVK